MHAAAKSLPEWDMNLESKRIWTGGCLDHEILVAYNMGRMSPALLERVADHLSSCNHCGRALESVQGTKDALLRNLQQYLPAAQSAAEKNGGTRGDVLAG